MPGPLLRTLPAATAAVLVALLAALAAPVPAEAHEADPRITTEITEVQPALPDDVVVQVQPSLAAQLVADNPTAQPLEVLDDEGRAFLRLSAAGVEADVASAAFLGTASPSGVVPPGSAERPAQWRTVSAGTSWGWFDHRLHPRELTAPRDPSRPADLGTWRVPLRYAGEPVEVRGATRFVPLLGSFVVSADPSPQGLTVQALPGRLPGLFLADPSGRQLTVLGVDGELFARLGPDGLVLNTASRTYVEDAAARGRVVDPPSPEPRLTAADPSATSLTWLDRRLRYPDDRPPDDVLRRGEPAVVQRWAVPVELDGVRTELTGQVRWVPDPALRAEPADDRSPVLLGGAAVLAAVVAGLALRHRLRRRRP